MISQLWFMVKRSTSWALRTRTTLGAFEGRMSLEVSELSLAKSIGEAAVLLVMVLVTVIFSTLCSRLWDMVSS